MVDFAPESIEARAAAATTDFGLRFINNLPAENKDNVVLSPMSMQNLLSMILLGSSDNSTTQQELAQVLGYSKTELLSGSSSSPQNRLRPHEAMHSVLQSIMAATHLPVSAHQTSPPSNEQPDLLNTNAASLPQEGNPNSRVVAAHLQTTTKEGDLPLDGQLNFTLANLVLTNRDLVELKPGYEEDLKAYYNVNVEQFSRDISKKLTNDSKSAESELALHERVNSWVKNMTHNQIEKLAEEADLSGDDLIMVMLNAAHFKGRWLHTFNAKATYDRAFFNHGSEEEATSVKFMRQKSVLGYADFSRKPLPSFKSFLESDEEPWLVAHLRAVLTEDAHSTSTPAKRIQAGPSDPETTPTIELSKEEARRIELTSNLDCSVLMLPFSLNEGQELSMVILLPSQRDGVAELQASLTSAALDEIYKSLSEQQVQVELPKFAFEASHDAKATLLKMGLKSIFEETAHLERMYNAKGKQAPVKVDKVIHKAKISVDESGAEAAGASMASIVLRNFRPPPTPIFIADHPFLFVIRHSRSNMPLFMGRVSSL